MSPIPQRSTRGTSTGETLLFSDADGRLELRPVRGLLAHLPERAAFLEEEVSRGIELEKVARVEEQNSVIVC